MSQPDDFNEENEELCSVVSSYLDTYVSSPTLETVTKDFEGQARIASLGAMLHVVADHIRAHGIDYDKQYLTSLPKEEISARIESFRQLIELQDTTTTKTNEAIQDAMDYLVEDSSRKYLLDYLMREINWISVSLLSASYISSLVLMRSVFELIVGIATRETGGMTDSIYSIQGLDDEEKKRVKNHWYRLCAWGHPFGKWQKEVCPIYASHRPLYHPTLFSLCLDEFVQLLDFFLVIAVIKYELDTTLIKNQLAEESIELSGLKMFCLRLEA